MNRSDKTLTLADLRRKRSAVETRISQWKQKIAEDQKELDHYEWAMKELFSDPNEGMPKRMAEEVLLESGRAMKPMEIYEEIKKLGYQGKPANIYVRLLKWKQGTNPTIVSVVRGLYAHRDIANDMKKGVMTFASSKDSMVSSQDQ